MRNDDSNIVSREDKTLDFTPAVIRGLDHFSQYNVDAYKTDNKVSILYKKVLTLLNTTYFCYLPVNSDVTHEQDAGVHVEVQSEDGKVAVNQAEGDGAANVLSDAEGKVEAEQEVRDCQVSQVDHHDAGHLLLS